VRAHPIGKSRTYCGYDDFRGRVLRGALQILCKRKRLRWKQFAKKSMETVSDVNEKSQ
jgi:hypothetical protein